MKSYLAGGKWRTGVREGGREMAGRDGSEMRSVKEGIHKLMDEEESNNLLNR